MRRHTILAVLAASVVAAAPAAAQGASRLSLRAADRAADKAAQQTTDTWEDADGVGIDDYDLADCDRDSARKASCDVTYTLDDGAECDDTIHVRLNAKHRLLVTSDSDGGDFADCTDPTDDSSADEGDDTSDEPVLDGALDGGV